MSNNQTQPEDLDINKLEYRIDELIEVCERLKDENRQLRSDRDNLNTERSSLLQKNELVRQRVEDMIGRLRALEKGA